MIIIENNNNIITEVLSWGNPSNWRFRLSLQTNHQFCNISLLWNCWWIPKLFKMPWNSSSPLSFPLLLVQPTWIVSDTMEVNSGGVYLHNIEWNGFRVSDSVSGARRRKQNGNADQRWVKTNKYHCSLEDSAISTQKASFNSFKNKLFLSSRRSVSCVGRSENYCELTHDQFNNPPSLPLFFQSTCVPQYLIDLGGVFTTVPPLCSLTVCCCPKMIAQWWCRVPALMCRISHTSYGLSEGYF